jgi:hypothetical protein
MFYKKGSPLAVNAHANANKKSNNKKGTPLAANAHAYAYANASVKEEPE